MDYRIELQVYPPLNPEPEEPFPPGRGGSHFLDLILQLLLVLAVAALCFILAVARGAPPGSPLYSLIAACLRFLFLYVRLLVAALCICWVVPYLVNPAVNILVAGLFLRGVYMLVRRVTG